MSFREKTFIKRPDGQFEQRTRTGSYKNVRFESLSADIQRKILALAFVEDGAWVPGIGGTETTNVPPRVYFYVELN